LLGVTEDKARSWRYLQQSAEAGWRTAEFDIGRFYDEGCQAVGIEKEAAELKSRD
jgi:TPR repeat protein